MNLDLVILEGPEAGRRIPVPAAPVTFGRAPAAAMAFPDDGFISSVHLSIQADPEGVRITDLRSTNGTFLNGERVSSALAGVGDVIQIGTMTMQVATAVVDAAPQAPAPVLSAARAAAPSSDATLVGAPVLPRMDIPAPPAASPSIVATTTIPRISVDASEQFKRKDTPTKPDAAETLKKRLRDTIAGVRGPLFLLVNAAADESIAAMLAMGDVDLAKHTLWKEDASVAPARWAPYLVSTTPDAQLLNVLLDRGWGKNWLSLFVSPAPLEELVAHFSKFLKVQMEQTGGIYFRFYDPQVLRQFLPSGSPAELSMFFGPVREWLLEGESRTGLLHAINNPTGLSLQTVSLSEEASGT